MQGRLCRVLALVLLLLYPAIGGAISHYGFTFSSVLLPKEPPDLNSAQLMFFYDPQRYQWRQFNVYFDAGVGYFWDSAANYHRNITIYSVAPVARYRFKRRGFLQPFLDLSLGLAYLNQTRIDSRNLGIHFAFQDRLGVGVSFGCDEKFSLSTHAIHYSNAHLSQHNSGMTALLLDVSLKI